MLKSKSTTDQIKYNPVGLEILKKFKGFAPIRAKVHRNYDSFRQTFTSEGSHIPVMLKDLLLNNEKKNQKIKSQLFKFGESSGLFNNLKIVKYNNKVGSPYSIDVHYDKHPVNIINVGYGVSQIMPIVVEMVTNIETTFSIQQPEVHLHPKAQAEFGELMYVSAVEKKNKFIVETHSDYTINRFRYKMSKYKKKGITGQVVFFERTKSGINVTSLPLTNSGTFQNEPPEAYSSFFLDEELKMLEF